MPIFGENASWGTLVRPVARVWARKSAFPGPNPDFGRFWPADVVAAGAKTGGLVISLTNNRKKNIILTILLCFITPGDSPWTPIQRFASGF